MGQRITGASPTECPACHGLGYNNACRAEMNTRWDREAGDYAELGTLRDDRGVALVGSGCLRCGGTGQLP